MDSTRKQSRRHRLTALSTAMLACIGLAACLPQPQPRQRIPVLPALPVLPVETAVLQPLVDTRPMTAALRLSLPYRNDPAWYDGLSYALLPFIEADRRLAPVPVLLEALSDPDLATRRGAAIALAKTSRWYWRDQPEGLAAALITATRDSDARVRENAVHVLGWIRPLASVEPALLVAVDDPDARVRWAAIRSLTSWERPETDPDRLTHALVDTDGRVRIATAYLYGFHAENAQTALADVLRRLGGDQAARRAAAEQVQFFSRHIDDAALPSVVAMLDDPDVRVRQLGTMTLSGTLFHRRYSGTDTPRPVPDAPALARTLATTLTDSDAGVREFAAWGLRSLGDTALPVLPELSAALEVEPDPDARIAMRYARKVVTGDDDDAAISGGDGTSWSDPALCLDHADYALGNLRPWDPEQKAWDLLGEPDAVIGGWSESDGGTYAIYRYRYQDLDVDVVGYGVELLTTTSPSIVVGQNLRIGMTREQILSIVFGVPPTPEALAAQRYVVTDCEDPYQEVYFHLDFDPAGMLWRMELFAAQP